LEAAASADGPLARGERAHHGAAGGVGHRVEDRVQLLNHSVEHSASPGRSSTDRLNVDSRRILNLEVN
jgi:hypothetical protein